MKTDLVINRKEFREAADAGLLLWRENFINFIPFFAVPLWILAFLLRIILPGDFRYFSWLIIWLLKPLFDRIIVHIISIKFFNKEENFIKLFTGLGKTIIRGLAGDLLWRRFSPLRAVTLPMRVLEKNINKTKTFAARKKILQNGGIDYCFILTVWGLAVEFALLFGLIFFNFTISELMFDVSLLWSSAQEMEIYLYAFWCINYILIETVYICMGFSLYINSRVIVEGWDLEILFRNLKKIAVVFFAFFIFLAPAEGNADDKITQSGVPLEELRTVLDSPDFGGEKKTWRIKLKKQTQEGSGGLSIFNWDLDFLKNLNLVFAYTLRFMIICAIAGLLIYLTYKLIKLNKIRSALKGTPSIGFINNKKENPKALLKKAIEFNEQGNLRLAWGYCTAAAIYSLAIYKGIVFPPHSTENDCAEIINKKFNNDPLSCSFNKLIKNWVYLAYAGRIPPDECFSEAINFCGSITEEGQAANG